MRIKELREEVNLKKNAKCTPFWPLEDIEYLLHLIDEQNEMIKRYITGLQFYASPDNYLDEDGYCPLESPEDVAKQALE